MTASGKGTPNCRDCRHVKPDTSVVSLFGLLPWKWDFARCGRTKRPEPLNAGSTPEIIVHRHPFVTVERAITFHSCGPAARNFEPRS